MHEWQLDMALNVYLFALKTLCIVDTHVKSSHVNGHVLHSSSLFCLFVVD